ncbi:unnamed protein product [Chondrus crispus]|uniref:Aminoglycoside phosphotransferase domain-containing protein n=1 Tax=Chondrus crispus TaxID=2769 RepID=R7QQD0_CHOCR|nr:unnamed protein product [Chondrus crispus]CDF39691.1 unnamed protein product [Chondrus crispus]|eukprot:XP_005709985.1 unnamed protein product [Chondrus crispus]
MPASNMTLDELPYFAQGAVLPEPLPTLGIHFIVKYGTGVDLMEGQNMLFVRQATTVPVPQVYAMFRETESGENYIVMERIQGRSLDHEWSLLCQREKHAVASKIKRGFEELRKLPSPGGFCSLGTRPLSDDIFGTDSESASLAGPFATESALNEAILRTLLRAQISIHKINFYRRAFSNVFCKHPPTYTHGNFQRSKVVIQRPWNTSNCDASKKND